MSMAKPKQKPAPPQSEPSAPPSDRLAKLLEVKVEAPPIQHTLKVAEQALAQAQKAKLTRRHKCRICGNPSCTHFQRVYDDNGEEFDAHRDPKTGKLFIDKDGNQV